MTDTLPAYSTESLAAVAEKGLHEAFVVARSLGMPEAKTLTRRLDDAQRLLGQMTHIRSEAVGALNKARAALASRSCPKRLWHRLLGRNPMAEAKLRIDTVRESVPELRIVVDSMQVCLNDIKDIHLYLADAQTALRDLAERMPHSSPFDGRENEIITLAQASGPAIAVLSEALDANPVREVTRLLEQADVVLTLHTSPTRKIP